MTVFNRSIFDLLIVQLAYICSLEQSHPIKLRVFHSRSAERSHLIEHICPMFGVVHFVKLMVSFAPIEDKLPYAAA